MSEARHRVTLPHPARTGPKTVGSCVCGWTITYGWGGHSDAAGEAEQHIETEGHARPFQARNFSGGITVMEGLSR